ncbi:MAG: ABC transporter ATP-binding protein [Fervidobacterium sp.]
MSEKFLEILNLTKFYGKRLAIKDITLHVSGGEIVGFIGPNGAGKTTTMRVALGFLKPTSGEIYLFGERLTRRNVAKLITKVGYVPGEVNYYGDVTVQKILEFYASFYNEFDSEYCEWLCKQFDIQLNKKFEELSLGNKKKVSIIQALAHKPRLLILDEPTNSLDPFVQKRLYNILEDLKTSGVGILLSSHVLNEVEKLCNRVVFIKDGKIVNSPLFNKATKKITLVTDSDSKIVENLENLFPEIVELNSQNSNLLIYFNGSTQRLVELLNLFKFKDILIEDLSLEDVFDKLYEE